MTVSRLLPGLFWLAACQGSLQAPLPELVDTRPLGSDAGLDKPVKLGADGGIIASSDTCGARVPSRLVLLSDFQHVSALRAMLGDEALSGEDLPNRQLKPFAQKGLVVNTSLVHTRWEWAAEAASKVKQAGCTTLDAACAETFLRTFAARAFRRPIEDEEITDLMVVYELAATETPLRGLQGAVEAVLTAPSFTYRRELGQAGKSEARTLDAYELASVLSFALTDGPPDDALWAAAKDGSLDKPSEPARQVERLLKLPAVRESLTGTLMAAWGMGNIFGAAKDPALFPSFTPQLQASMYHETELLVNDVLWTRAAPINELLSTSKSFVDAQLAALYGLPKPSGAGTDFLPVTLPVAQRAGLLTQAGVLSMLARSDTTSVVARGLFVRGLLCMSKVPSPPESLSGAISMLLKEDLTERERADVRAKNPTCAGCHVGIDPFGLLLEKYDALGRYREKLDGMVIDTKVEVPGTASYAGEQTDALGFTLDVADEADFTSCVATRVLSYALQDDALLPSDCQVEEAIADLTPTELDMPTLVQRVLASPSLRSREQETP